MSASIEWRPGGAMTIEQAATQWAAAASHLASDLTDGVMQGVMHVDLSSVERLDTAGCQILLACREDAKRRALDWRLTGCTDQAIEVLRLLGCDGILEAITENAENAQ